MNARRVTRVVAYLVIAIFAVTSVGMKFTPDRAITWTVAGVHNVMAMHAPGSGEHPGRKSEHHGKDCPFCSLAETLRLPQCQGAVGFEAWCRVENRRPASQIVMVECLPRSLGARAPPRPHRDGPRKIQTIRSA